MVTLLVTDSRNNLAHPFPPPPCPPALVSNISCSFIADTKWKTTAVQFLSFVFQNWLVLFSFSSRNGSQRGSSMLRFCWFVIVHVSSYAGLQKKIFWSFKLRTISSCSSTVATKWNTPAMKMPLLFEAGLLIWF